MTEREDEKAPEHIGSLFKAEAAADPSPIGGLEDEVDEVRFALVRSAHQRARELVEFQLAQIRTSMDEALAAKAWRAEAEQELQRLRSDLAALEARHQDHLQSSSWKMTAPVRAVKRFMLKVVEAARASKVVRQISAYSLRFKASRTESAAYRLPVRLTIEAPPPLPVRLVAFYLPQFHPIPENDAWWGEGFTEWTNVRRGRPRYEGQAQPLVPGDLGYYDLLETQGIQKKQANLAQVYGIEGFCFYFYWFAGQTLLEGPIKLFSEDPEITLPYCLCWANENWSRRWDGLDHEILLAQAHSAEDDLAFISHISGHLKSPRYLRVHGRPLLIVYRPSLLPDPLGTARRWRDWCRSNGVGEIHLAYTQSFESVDPALYDFDSAIEFPPNNTAPPLATDLRPLESNFRSTVYDYTVYPKRAENYPHSDYTLYRGVFPAWDNEARRPGVGTSFAGAKPELYRRWLSLAAKDTLDRSPDYDGRLVFINAWNEWAEGAILEPDARLGYAHLQATRDALEIASAGRRGRLVLVVHDAFRHGAQFLALHLAQILFEDLNYGLDIVLLDGGPLESMFRRFGRVHSLAGCAPDGERARNLALRLSQEGAIGGICNTTVTGLFLHTLSAAGIPCISLVHEMATLLGKMGLAAHADAIGTDAKWVVFPADEVRASFEKFVGHPIAAALIRTQGAYKRNCNQTFEERMAARSRVRRKLGISPTDRIVLGVGYGDERKGFDLFMECAGELAKRRTDAVFVWVGETTARFASLAQFASSGHLVLAGFQEATDDFYSAADVYALTSREDPFPTVVLEAFDAGLPVVAFAGTGGFDRVLAEGSGLTAPQFDIPAFTNRVNSLLSNSQTAAQYGEAGRARLAQDFNFRRYAFDVAKFADPGLLQVSAIVPNYNYARYMEARLNSIASQTVPVYELVILDDASSDNSLEAIRMIAPTLGLPWQLFENDLNSGSVFLQWLKGVEAAKGDLAWIAEADDLADPDLIATAVAAFADPSVVMSYVQSRQIDGHGLHLGADYFAYTDDVSTTRWRRSYVADGVDEIKLGLSVKNTIPNVSAVLFRRQALLDVLREQREVLGRLRFAGDWLVYVKLLEKGRVAFNSHAANVHRRHVGGVTIGGLNAQQLVEILELQQIVRRTVDVPPSLKRRGRAYAQELYSQFGLSGASEGNIGEDERFSPSL